MPTSYRVRVEHLYLSPGHNFFGHHGEKAADHAMVEVDKALCIAGRGIHGDRFFDYKKDYKGQVTFFSMEVFERVCHELHLVNLPPCIVRRNAFIRGVDLNLLVGHTFKLQGVTFSGTEECRPCYWMDEALAPGAEKLLARCGGLRARILTDGHLKARDGDRNWSRMELES